METVYQIIGLLANLATIAAFVVAAEQGAHACVELSKKI